MSETDSRVAAQTSKAVDLIDRNLTKFSATLEDLSDRITTVGTNGDVPANLTSAVVRQIESLKDRVQSIDGEKIVAQSKDAVERHPAGFTILAAITGAVVAQVVIFAVGNERRRLPQTQGS
jgi:hypothetical protein